MNSRNAAAMFLRRGFPWEHESAVARSSADLLQQTADFPLQITRDHAWTNPAQVVGSCSWRNHCGAVVIGACFYSGVCMPSEKIERRMPNGALC